MTINENARKTLENTVLEYNYEDRRHGSDKYSFWEIMNMIKNAYSNELISFYEAERYCNLMHISFDEMMTAEAGD